MEQNGTNNRNGELVVSEEVIAKIAGVAAKDVAGVADLAPIPADIQSVIFRDRTAKAVRVSSADSAMTVDVAITVEPGSSLNVICEQVQKAVKGEIQNMLGRPVAKVNVIVADIKTESAAEAE